MKAVEQSHLGGLTLRNLGVDDEIKVMLESIPNVKVKKLLLRFEDEDFPEEFHEKLRVEFLEASKKNSSVQSFDAEHPENFSIFDDNERAILDRYAERNKGVA